MVPTKLQKIQTIRLMLLWTPRPHGNDSQSVIERAIAGGVDAIQIRVKDATTRELFEFGMKAKDITDRCGVLLFINDRADVAIACGADGVHLGQDDLTIAEARSFAPESLAIGYSTHSIEHVRDACAHGADLLGFGPMFQTATKPNEPAIGPSELATACAESTVPVLAIGGLTPERILTIGARRAAVSSYLLDSADPERAARELRRALERNATK
ncbi:MAG: thiamine phosphate synthase [Planctomycetota bacterium]